MFKKVEGSSIVLITKGSYKPSEVYEYGSYLFAKNGSSYIRLYKNKTTSKDGTSFCGLDAVGTIGVDRFARLCFSTTNSEAKSLTKDDVYELLKSKI